MTSFNSLRTRNDLAHFLGIAPSHLSYVLYVLKTNNLYHSFEIPKKSGGVRHIDAPTPILKEVQQKLATVLEDQLYEIQQARGTKPNISHAFEKEKSIISNARIHKNKRIVVNVDLCDFFDSFHFRL